ncbi:conserved hypothetical protein [Trichormus variabilis ATCC 29413]|uniref:Uncharacterized protein n=2 Tax=Anabaena variabilis TaxID=264691 RepID=Q3M7E9_TRIV2|nr:MULTISPECIES: hypothetical protein [Nostocaceae]ABA23087.1 conserved hypothetical protein [Trichormus variabilis ATCC 29413]MBC1216013.1 hypothetical protein [Trichormus variabilis ARAD]MBC1255360.1 hypothetical protein [Trichormus variabilis V5]MBC1265709.1 hypothetical protein [Trichormus variabilis FSR]MBC1303462.1 hypothetical protein [Trichormus variabilis N2B]
MLKPLLLSGWFRVQPFLNYVVVIMLIAPLVVASGHSSSAKPSKAIAKTTTETETPDAVPQEAAVISEQNLAEVLTASPVNSRMEGLAGFPQEIVVDEKPQILPADNLESLVAKKYSHTNKLLAAVELAPTTELPVGEKSAVQSLKQQDQAILNAVSEAHSLVASQVASSLKPSTPTSTPDISIDEPQEGAEAQADPIGSPHPIPWQWILSTQEAIGSRGGSGVRYYRSVPVVSPDGKYAVYSRVQIEVKPEMHNTKVNSVLFVEDRQTKKLRVMAATTITNDPLLDTQQVSAEPADSDGKIGVLVPVSWSEKSDRFLARKFEGIFNTGDSTDQAVIWDRQKNQTNTVAPAQEVNDHEKIAVLLGWSKNDPDHVIFRAGEMGEEEWPLVKVAIDGKTAATTDADQPITYGDKLTQVWAGPQVASR